MPASTGGQKTDRLLVWDLDNMMSCRVLSRGVGTFLLQHIMGLARAENVRLLVEMAPNVRNRMMYATYKVTGFTERGGTVEVKVLEHALLQVPLVPAYVTLITRAPKRATDDAPDAQHVGAETELSA